LAFKNVNAIAHYTDWIVGHVHVGALAWNGFIIAGMLYWLAEKLFKTELYSQKLANTHFWIGTIGILFYTIPLYIAGFMQALMWKEFNPDGTLVYGNFLETVTAILPMYWMRALGGTLYFTGFCILAYNLIMTAKKGSPVEDDLAEAMPLKKIGSQRIAGEHWHSWLERRTVLFTILTTIAILIGGLVEFVPLALVDSNVPKIASVKPYTPLELEGRDIYIREGCNNCHSQMIRPFRSEVERYGEYSKAGEFVYDHPFLWGSRRTGPDLHRIGKKYNSNWHFNHFLDPMNTSPMEDKILGTTRNFMPKYTWFITSELDYSNIQNKMKGLKAVGVPYSKREIEYAPYALEAQAKSIEQELRQDPDYVTNYGDSHIEKKEVIAVIAYLQRLGTDIKNK